MNKHMHRKITEEALEETGLNKKALKFVAYANQDSDHQSGPAGLAMQHFCGPAESQNIVNICEKFIKDSLEMAALLARRGNEVEAIDALYCLGRAFHCVQDFYAHSNWIALDKILVWHGKNSPRELKFCGITGPKKWENDRTYKSHKRSTSKSAEKLYKALREGRTPETDIRHPDMHLDFERSWADRVISRWGATGGGSAYRLAHKLARQDTLDHWAHFVGDLMARPEYDPRTTTGALKWSLLMGYTPDDVKSRYSMTYNRTKCDTNSAINNLLKIDPFSAFSGGLFKNTKSTQTIRASRKAFEYMVVTSVPYKDKRILDTLRWDFLIF